MRGINKSLTESIYDAVKESVYTDEDVSARQLGTPVYVFDNISRAIEDMQGGDIQYIFDSYNDDTNEINLTVFAYAPADNEDGSEELKREITIKPNGISYDAIKDALDEWDRNHNTPDVFYEGVMVQTGSTTVISDETGVSIEDNGNTITTGNGVVVNVDNEVDTLPVEDEFEETEETFEEAPSEDEVEETEEEEEELIEPNEDGAIDDAPVNEEVLEKPSEETEEEQNNSRIEEAADGYDNFQNIEIYQNPEIDYSMLDVTELDTVEDGDTRSIDMGAILADLDESLTEHFHSSNWGVINSFLTRKGNHKKTNESYSSAILELTLPKLNESMEEFKNVYILEVYGDKKYKNCIVRDSKSKILKQYSGKSRNPVKFFENFILSVRKDNLKEDVEVFKPLELAKDKDITNTVLAKDNRISKFKERQNRLRKSMEKRFKQVSVFDLDKEPDQKYKLNKAVKEAVEEVSDKDAINLELIQNALKDAGIKSESTLDLMSKDILKDLKSNYTKGCANEDGIFYGVVITDAIAKKVEQITGTRPSLTIGEDCEVKKSKKKKEIKEAEEEIGLIDVEDNIGEEDAPADELEEDMTDVAIFHRKPASVDAMKAAEENGITTNKSNYTIVGTKELSNEEFNKFANHLSSDTYEWLKDFDTTSDDSGMFNCVEVINKDDNSYSLLVDPSGYSYARYVAIKNDIENQEDNNEEEIETTEVEETTEE